MYPSLQNEIDCAFLEFKQFKNDITELEVFCEWSNNVEKMYFNIDSLERLRNKSLIPLFDLISSNFHIQELIKSYPLALQAMGEFNKINTTNEQELIDWLFKYEDNELDYGDYVKVDNWKKNNLILHSLDNSVVIDSCKYSSSLMFSDVYSEHYWNLFEKYKITEEEFELAKNKYGIKSYDLRTFLKFHEKRKEK